MKGIQPTPKPISLVSHNLEVQAQHDELPYVVADSFRDPSVSLAHNTKGLS